MTEISTETEKLKITKANQLIEITLVESSTRLSLREQKIILAVISQISPDDDVLKVYRMTVSEVEKLTGIHTQDIYSNMKDICSRLISSAICIKEPNNSEGFLIATWFADVEYIPSESVIEFSISQKLKPYLLNLKNTFTTYHLNQIMGLHSTYSIRLYELLRQFLPLKHVKAGRTKAFRDITINDFRAYLGIPKNKYDRYRDLRRFVIERAQSELLGETDLSFEFSTRRKGRKIYFISFVICHNPHFEEVEEDPVLSGNHIPVNDQEANPEADAIVLAMLKMNLPELTQQEIDLITLTYRRELITESLLALSVTEVKTTRKKAFFGILQGKRKDEEEAGSAPHNDPDDISWAENIGKDIFDFDD